MRQILGRARLGLGLYTFWDRLEGLPANERARLVANLKELFNLGCDSFQLPEMYVCTAMTILSPHITDVISWIHICAAKSRIYRVLVSLDQLSDEDEQTSYIPSSKGASCTIYTPKR